MITLSGKGWKNLLKGNPLSRNLNRLIALIKPSPLMRLSGGILFFQMKNLLDGIFNGGYEV